MSKLTVGLTVLKNGLHAAPAQPVRAEQQFAEAAAELTRGSANYAEQLRDATGRGDPAYAWLIARHLTVSALAEAAAHLRLGQKSAAVRAIAAALDPLRAHAKAVFARTVGADPATFLMPALAEHGITVEAVAGRLRQAAHAGWWTSRPGRRRRTCSSGCGGGC